jgi:hypothetical protein
VEGGDHAKVTWRQIVWRARRLETAADAGEVPPAAGAAFVRLVLRFQQQLVVTDEYEAPHADTAAASRVPVPTESGILQKDVEPTSADVDDGR